MVAAAAFVVMVVMVVAASALVVVVLVVMVAAAALVVVILVMVMTAAALVVILVVMMAASAFVVVVLVVMVAASAFVVVVLVMVMTASTFVVIVIVVVVTAAAVHTMFMVMFVVPFPAGGGGGSVPGIDNGTALDGAGDGSQFRQQSVRVLGGDPQLLGGEGDGGLLHLGVGIEFGFDLGRAVGAVQIFNHVNLSCHGGASLHVLTYEQSFM